jgi:hypothetical protein
MAMAAKSGWIKAQRKEDLDLKPTIQRFQLLFHIRFRPFPVFMMIRSGRILLFTLLRMEWTVHTGTDRPCPLASVVDIIGRDEKHISIESALSEQLKES